MPGRDRAARRRRAVQRTCDKRWRDHLRRRRRAESARALSIAEWLGGRMGLETFPVFVMSARSWNGAAPSPAQIVTGDPVRELRVRATREDARMIVVGSRGHGALRRALLGSVSAALAGTAPVPVLVVPPEARLPATVGDPAHGPRPRRR